MKRIVTIVLAALMSLSMLAMFTGCDNDTHTTTDPEVRAYDEWWIRTHDIFGNPR